MTVKSLPDDPFTVTLDSDNLKRRSVKGSLATIVSQAAKLCIQLLSQVILARLLFPADYGLVAMAYPVIALLQVFNDIGLSQAVIQRPILKSDQVSALFWFNICISCLLALIVAMLAPIAAWVYGEPRLIPLMIVLGLNFPIAAIGILPNALLARHMRFGIMARNEVIAMLTGAFVTILCAWLGFSYWSLLIGQFSNAAAAILLVWFVTSWRPLAPKMTFSVGSDVKFGANITLSNLATFATTSGDNIIVGLTSGKVSLGLYDRSYNLVARPIEQMMTPLSRVALPLLSRLTEKPEEYRATYLMIFRISTMLLVPAMLVCISNGSTMIAVFLGARWTAAGPIFSWLCVGGLTSAIYASTFWLLISQDRAEELRLFATIAAAINVASYLIGSFWGVVGIAVAASIGFVLLTTPLLLFAATRRGPVSLHDIMHCMLPFVLSASLVYSVIIFWFESLSLNGFIRIAAATVLSYSLFISLALFSSANRSLVMSTFRSFKGLFPA